MMQSPLERRANPRYPLRAGLTFTYAGQTYDVNCHDLGKGGLSFEAEVDLPASEALLLTLRLGIATMQTQFSVRGSLRWKLPGETPRLFRYGLVFSDLNAAQQRVLSEFLGGTDVPATSAA